MWHKKMIWKRETVILLVYFNFEEGLGVLWQSTMM